jgi:hypothetical protein
MARVAKNIIMQGLSGMIGGQLVLSIRKGQTIIGAAPSGPKGPATAGQVAHRTRFQKAIFYAKNAALDPATRALYEAKAKEDDLSVFNVIVADFMKAPDIKALDLTNYTGRVGDTILVVVEDDFSVERVLVKIENGDGTLVEQGAAVQQPNPSEWVYTATVRNASLAGDKLTVTVNDRPGNTDTEVRTL